MRTYCQLFKNVYEDFVFCFLLRVKFLHGSLNSRASNSARFEKLRFPALLLLISWVFSFFNQYRLVNNVLPNVLGCHKLGMPVINYLIDYLIDKYEVFSYRLFIQDTTVVSKHFHHAVDHVVYD